MVQHESRYSSFFVAVAALFVTCLVISNVIAVKLVMVQGLVLPAGIVVFPLSYLLADVLTEVYGYRAARRVIWLGFFCNLLAVIAIWVGGLLPAAPFWDGASAYERILGATPWILAASLAAYLVGEFANTMIMTIAFWGLMPLPILLGAVVTQWLVKSAYEALATPLTYAMVGFLKRREGIDTYDRGISFNPFALGD